MTDKTLGQWAVDTHAGIYLRLMTWFDTDLIVAWRNSEQVRRNFVYQELFTREGHENWIRTMIETGKVVQMMICDLGGGRPLGSVYIRDIDRQHNKAEYGIFIGEPSARGRGWAPPPPGLCCGTVFRRKSCTGSTCGHFRTTSRPFAAMKKQALSGRHA